MLIKIFLSTFGSIIFVSAIILEPKDIKSMSIVRVCESDFRYKVVAAEYLDFLDSYAETTVKTEVACARACFERFETCEMAMYHADTGRCRFSNQYFPCRSRTSFTGPSFFRKGHLMLHCFECGLSVDHSIAEFAKLLEKTGSQSSNKTAKQHHEFDLPPFVVTKDVKTKTVRKKPPSKSKEKEKEGMRFIFGSHVNLMDSDSTNQTNRSIPKPRKKGKLPGETKPMVLGPMVPTTAPLDPSNSGDIVPKIIREILPELRNAIEDILIRKGYIFVRTSIEGPVTDSEGNPSVVASFSPPNPKPLAALIREEPIPVIHFPKLPSNTTSTPPIRLTTTPENTTAYAKFATSVETPTTEFTVESITPDPTPESVLNNTIDDVLPIDPSTKGNRPITTLAIDTRDRLPGTIITEPITVHVESGENQNFLALSETAPSFRALEDLNNIEKVFSFPGVNPKFRALAKTHPLVSERKDIVRVSHYINETTVESIKIRSFVIGPPDPPHADAVVGQLNTNCPDSLLLPCSYGVGKGCRLTMSTDGCRICTCPFRSPARGCFGSIFMSEQMRQGLLYKEMMCENPDRPAQSVIRWYRKMENNHNVDKCVAVQYPYCDSIEDRVHRMPRTREECEFFCYNADVELVRQLRLFRHR